MQGYAVEKTMKIRGEINVAKRVPIICVRYWVLGGVPRRKPTPKSPIRSRG
jgi:hypothetical protein